MNVSLFFLTNYFRNTFLLEIKGRLLPFILLKNNYMASSHDYIEENTPNKKIEIN